MLSSPSNRKLKMQQIEQKVCLEDTDSFIVPPIPSSVFHSVAINGGSVISECPPYELEKRLETLEGSIVTSSKNLFQ